MENQNMQSVPMPGVTQANPGPEPAFNPLTAHFRQPKIHLSLPSGGKYWKQGALELPATGEVPVYAMTAKDEIALRTPDGLMNGQSVVSVIESCCPAVRDAWGMPSIDTDALLIAIRIASFGEGMDVKVDCPECNEENTYAVPLPEKLGLLRLPDYASPVEVLGLKIYIQPQYYDAISRLNQLRFQEERISSVVADLTMPEEDKLKQVNESFTRIMNLGFDNVTESTSHIEMPDGTLVNEKTHIRDFYQQADAGALRSVQDKIVAIAKEASPTDLKLKCNSCEHAWETPLEFDYTSFFAEASSS
jgi:hypothetical protein|tara:strand:- start:836 stop:1747 length:912 start_codon:yes stop_codon:yes gene_type:complete